MFRGPRGLWGLEVAKAARMTNAGDRKKRGGKLKGSITLSSEQFKGGGRLGGYTSSPLETRARQPSKMDSVDVLKNGFWNTEAC